MVFWVGNTGSPGPKFITLNFTTCSTRMGILKIKRLTMLTVGEKRCNCTKKHKQHVNK